MKKTLLIALILCLIAPLVGAQDFADMQGPTKVGEEVRYSAESPHFFAKAGVEKAQLVWREEISWPDATYIAPHFSHFVLPRGARVVIRHPEGLRSWTYHGFGKGDELQKDGFWGIHIPGDTAIVELYSRVPVDKSAVRIDSFAWGLPAWEELAESLLDGEWGTKALCGQDDSEWAQCYSGTIYNKSKAVARLLIGGSSACTGWLLGDQGHLITNEHCISTNSAAQNTDYEFLAEGSCNTNCASFGACPGIVEATSGTLIQDNATLDYALILLPTNLSSTYGFFQMRSAGAVVDEQIYIPGHPGAWGKKIAVDSGHSSDASGQCEVFSLNEAPCSGGGGSDVGYYCDTQGGSSGSPVVASSDNAVVALHHCANCPNRGVPVQAIISNLGSNLPSNATVGGTPPPPPPPPSCTASGQSCTGNSQCCSGNCKGKPGRQTCK